MPTVFELMIMSGVPEDALWFLRKYGLEFDDDDFDIDRNHRKALADLRNRRLSAFVLAYAWRCRDRAVDDEDFARFDNLTEIAKIRGFSIADAFFDIRSRQIESELLPTAQHWVDRATTMERHSDAFERLARWCKETLRASPFEVDHAYLAVRLLVSLPREQMYDYPKLVQRALNRIRHHGFLDGWWRVVSSEDGKNKILYRQPTYDL